VSATVQQVFVLVGLVVVGALASYLSAARMDRVRWRRQIDTRWDTTRMEAYSAYAHAVKTMVQWSLRLAAQRGLGSISQPVSEADGLAALADAEANRGALWEQVLLLGTPSTVEAGRRWHESALAAGDIRSGTRIRLRCLGAGDQRNKCRAGGVLRRSPKRSRDSWSTAARGLATSLTADPQ
jgi:hypothetical protein